MKNTKRILAAMLALAAALSLCACGSETSAAEEEKNDAPQMTSSLPGENLSIGEDTSKAEAEKEESGISLSGAADKAAAMNLIGEDVKKLYDTIGEPADSAYASSCMGPGDDGELYYDGFTVYTYREGDSEKIQDVD